MTMENSLAILENLHALPERIDALQAALLTQEQAECPVIHRFGPGLYIREVQIPAGVIAIGHIQRQAHLNVLLQGKVTIVRDDGMLETLTAPMVFVGKPGRKVGYIWETTVWQNIYATTETDVAKLEEMYLEKTEGWHEHLEAEKLLRLPALEDQDDYRAVLKECGITQAEVEEDMRTVEVIPLPHGSYKVKLGESLIHGTGLMATAEIAAGEFIAPMRIGEHKTIAGRFTNHAKQPNARPERVGNEVWLVALHPITGCKGGHDGEEITIDYREALKLALQLNEEQGLCPESQPQ